MLALTWLVSQATNAALDENVPKITVDRSKVLRIARVSQRIEIDDRLIRLSLIGIMEPPMIGVMEPV